MDRAFIRASFGNPANDEDDTPPTDGSMGALPAYPVPENMKTAFETPPGEDGAPGVMLSSTAETEVVAYVRRRFEVMKRFRHKRGLYERFRFALRCMYGQYDADQLQEIRAMGSADTYSRLVATKAQAATAMLQDIYTAGARPWNLEPTPEPELPSDAVTSIKDLLAAEVDEATRQNGGQPPDQRAIIERERMLEGELRRGVKNKAKKEAEKAAKKANDILVEGNFYGAIDEFLIDLPYFPYACLKGPVVEMKSKLKYASPEERRNNPDAQRVTLEDTPTLMWRRVSPMDLYFAPMSSDVSGSDMLERVYYTRDTLSKLLDVPGWEPDKIRNVLREYSNGLNDWLDSLDTERAYEENKEMPYSEDSEIICGVEYHSYLSGASLLEMGVDPGHITDPEREYLAQVWIVGNYVLKAQVSPSLRQRHPYFVTAYTKSAGSVIGQALPDVLTDVQDVANASLRNLVNNMGLASGPQVTVMTGRLDEGNDVSTLHPWKMWYMQDEPGQNSSVPPVNFYQPQSNAQELLYIYKEMQTLADEVSLIPRYQYGGQAQGAGRTASGLNMLMDAASKQQAMVASNIDKDIIKGTLENLYELLMLTSDDLRGDEQIVVEGVKKVQQQEVERVRLLEFAQFTMNPTDTQIMGPDGRAALLREIAKSLNMPEGEIIPLAEEIEQKAREASKLQEMQAMAAAAGQGPPSGGAGGASGGAGGQSSPTSPANPTGPRTNNVQTRQTQQQAGGAENQKSSPLRAG